MRNSFPEKSEEEIEDIAKKFYSHFCDVMMESFKAFTISQKQISNRMVVENPELLNKFFEQNKSIILAGGHYNNWEWIAVALDQQIKHETVAIYSTLSNKFFDEKMRNTRGKFGLKMISTKIVKKHFENNIDKITATIFAFDQSPGNVERAHWVKFLNQDTATQFGTELFAKQYNYPVLYGTITKVKRGFYTVKFCVVTDEPQQAMLGEIIEKISHLLEQDILNAPQYWLWTHRRWKHKKPA